MKININQYLCTFVDCDHLWDLSEQVLSVPISECFFMSVIREHRRLPHLWPLHQRASQLLWGWWPKCPRPRGLTTPDHKMLLCGGSPGSARWFEFDLEFLCLGRGLRGHTGSAHPSADRKWHKTEELGHHTHIRNVFNWLGMCDVTWIVVLLFVR